MTHQEYADGLRRLADFYERHQDAVLPYEGHRGCMYIFVYTAEDFARTVAAFGNGAKRFEGDTLIFVPDIGLNIQVRCDRDKVCERRVVGTRHVPEQVIPEKVIPAHEEELVEWDCKPILAKRHQTIDIPVAIGAGPEEAAW